MEWVGPSRLLRRAAADFRPVYRLAVGGRRLGGQPHSHVKKACFHHEMTARDSPGCLDALPSWLPAEPTLIS